jgi:endonuclease/exonuclease/phosphatase family metal-dependent hydrolase
MTFSLSRLLHLLLFFSCIGGSSTAMAGIRVMSFNIRLGTAADGPNHWDLRKERVVETITKFQPDLLGTQEVVYFQRDYLVDQLSAYESFGAGREDGKEKGEMMTIFFRRERFEKIDGGHFWLSEEPDMIGSKGWDAALPRLVSWVKLRDLKHPERLPLLFANTHFDHQGEVAREESALLVRRQLASIGSGCHLVLTGDFNADEGSVPYRNLFEPGVGARVLKDTYRLAFREKGPGEGTFSGFAASNTAGPRIDWIAVGESIRVKSAAIDRSAFEGRTPSDHFPVTAILEFP